MRSDQTSAFALGFHDYSRGRKAGDNSVAPEEGRRLGAGAGREVGDQGAAGGAGDLLGVAPVGIGVNVFRSGGDDGDGSQSGLECGSVRHNVHAESQSAHYRGLMLRLREREDYLSRPFLAIERHVARAHYRYIRSGIEDITEWRDAADIQPGRGVGTLGQSGRKVRLAICDELNALPGEFFEFLFAPEELVVRKQSLKTRKGTEQIVPFTFAQPEEGFDRARFFNQSERNLRIVPEGSVERTSAHLDNV